LNIFSWISDRLRTCIDNYLYKIKIKEINHILVLIGTQKFVFFLQIVEFVKKSMQMDLIILGYVPNEDLVKFFNITHLPVYHSLYKDFDLLTLEAITCRFSAMIYNSTTLKVLRSIFTFNPMILNFNR
ncbi:MAG: hypothetical protein ACXVHV_07575, partial [Methanobacterium sp.]